MGNNRTAPSGLSKKACANIEKRTEARDAMMSMESEDGAISSELSHIEELIIERNKARELLKGTVLELKRDTHEAHSVMLEIIDAHKELVSELRTFRKTVEFETKLVNSAMKSVFSGVNLELIGKLAEFRETIDHINSIEPNIITKKLFEGE